MSSGASQPFEVEPPDVAHLVTEDDTPVDNLGSEKQQRLLTEPLYASWAGPPPEEGEQPRPFLATANVGMYATPRDTPLVPDVLLSTDVAVPQDVWKKEHRCYFFWEFGKPPDVVIEIVSNREGGELGSKRRAYARMRIAHYVVFDPGKKLGSRTVTAFELRGDMYQVVERPVFPALGIALAEWEGEYEDLRARWLRWTYSNGRLVLTGAERASSAENRVSAAETRASAAENRASAAETRAQRLADRLRDLGVDPENA